MMNPSNPNKFIGIKDQERMNPLTDPQTYQQQFNTNRFSQPLPPPGVGGDPTISPVMQQQKGNKQRAMQPSPKPDMADNRLERTTTQIEQVPQQNAPLKQTNYPHADKNKGRPYVVNERPGVWQPGTEDRSRDTLFLPNNFRGQKGKMIDEDDYIDNAKINKEEYFQVGVQDLEDQGRIKIRK